MAIAYVVHASEDSRFVEQQLVVPLSVLGFDGWVAAKYLAPDSSIMDAQARAMAASSVVLVVVSAGAARSAMARHELKQAAKIGRRVVPVRIDHTPLEAVGLESLAAIDLRHDPAQPLTPERVALALRSLPSATSVSRDAGVEGHAVPIPWDAEVCSALLARAVAQHDDSQSGELVARLAAWLRRSGTRYGAGAARKDLGTLRRERQFPLMRRYASAVRATGMDDPNVMRQYAQALIELGQFDDAIDVLKQILAQPAGGGDESYEARGLLGRAHKQMYVNDPGPHTGHLLLSAIGYYHDVFREDPELVWQGINAATCMTRAARDLAMVGAENPQHIAREILETLARRAEEKELQAFELATRVEALALLLEFDAAEVALSDYLQHPDAHAFEVSSTHRQFEQVLQPQERQGRVLVDRLWEAVQRHRAPLALRAEDDATRVSALVSVTDPNWTPRAEVTVSARLGTIIAIECRPSAIKGLLADPLVLGVTESHRTSGGRECVRSMPFLRVPPEHRFTEGDPERGKNALVAVIDDGIDVLHQAFLDEKGESRIVGVWDQRDTSGLPPKGFDFGTYHDATAIAGYVKTQQVPASLGRDPDGHGTHVASIAVGRPAGQFTGGVAPEAQLLFVIADPRNPLGYSVEHVAALNFIAKVADESNKPVVVNVSQGMNAGPHDGRSPLEQGFENFLGLGGKAGRVIVKSAGNAGSANAHAGIQIAAGTNAKVQWKRSKDPNWEYDRLEFWWSQKDTYEFVLVSPSGNRSAQVTIRNPTVNGMVGNCPYRLQFVRRYQFNGDSQLVIEIGSADGNTGQVPKGNWTLEIKHVEGPGNLPMDGWIERGPLPASEFLPKYANSAKSLTVPGTAPNVITVGAIEVGEDDSISDTDYTSLGPTRDGRNKPDISAPGTNVVAARSGTSDEAFADNGTSMAAPFVTGAVALLLSRAVANKMDPLLSSAQICPVLQEQTRNRNTLWNPAQGFGVIDVAALLAAFE